MGAAAANLLAVPLAAVAQQTEKVHRIGFLRMGNAPVPAGSDWDPALLRDLGWIEGKNLVIERRYAGDNAELLRSLAAELVRRNVEIIATVGTDAAVAAKEATTSIPIVISAGDPVGAGLVTSLSRPGGNITGFSLVARQLRVKGLEVFHELLPSAQRVAELVNPANPFFRVGQTDYEDVYRSFGMQPIFIEVATARDLANAFAELARRRAQALVVPLDNLFLANSSWIIRVAAESALPTLVWSTEMVKDGALVSYTLSLAEADQRFAYFIDKILRGANAGDLPIEQPTKFVLVINLKTAKALGVTIPQAVLLRADEVIE
jgi:putative ABC transport system substrate-binding protein